MVRTSTYNQRFLLVDLSGILLGGVILLLSVIYNKSIDADSFKNTVKIFWFGSYYWYIIAYVGLYVLAPVLNMFIGLSSKKQFLSVLILFFFTEFIYGWVVDSKCYAMGYSIISFVGLYLLACYLKKYGIGKFSTFSYLL